MIIQYIKMIYIILTCTLLYMHTIYNTVQYSSSCIQFHPSIYVAMYSIPPIYICGNVFNSTHLYMWPCIQWYVDSLHLEQLLFMCAVFIHANNTTQKSMNVACTQSITFNIISQKYCLLLLLKLMYDLLLFAVIV